MQRVRQRLHRRRPGRVLFRLGDRVLRRTCRGRHDRRMTSSTPEPVLSREQAVLAVPRLLGYVPRESVVLAPVRNGALTGALRFSLPDRDPVTAARAYLGAMGRFGRAEAAVAVLYTAVSSDPRCTALVEALEERARRIGLGGLEVLRAGGSTRSVQPAARPDLVPSVERHETLEVAARVDALLDRHPTARLPAALEAGADAALLRASRGGEGLPRTAALAALIVCAQRPEWMSSAVERVSSGGARPSVIALVARAAAVAPATERAPVLVLLAQVLRLSGRREDALAVARWATSADPHDVPARLLRCALEGREEGGARPPEVRAARGRGPHRSQSRAQASVRTPRRICSISSNSLGPTVSGGASCTTGSPRSSARQ